MKENFDKLIFYKIILLSFASIGILLFSSCIGDKIKPDSIIIVVGNIIIALTITRYLTRKQKKDEISLDHAIKDISDLISLLYEIKKDIKEYLEAQQNKDYLHKEFMSKMSLLEQSLNMLNSHKSINKNDIQTIQTIYESLEDNLSSNANIADEWYDHILKMHRHFLQLKNSVSQKFRD